MGLLYHIIVYSLISMLVASERHEESGSYGREDGEEMKGVEKIKTVLRI